MKKILFLIALLLLSIQIGFADTSLTLSTDKDNYNIDDTITLNIEIASDQNLDGINVEGIQGNFWVIGQQEGSSVSIINWATTTKRELVLKLQAQKDGDYTLWPVTTVVDGKTISSDTKNITVSWTSLKVKPKTVQQNPKNKTEKSGTGVNEKTASLQNQTGALVKNQDTQTPPSLVKNTQEDLPHEVIWLNGEKMTTPYANKGFLLGLPFSWLSLGITLILLALLVFYWILYSYLKNIPLPEEKKTTPLENKKEHLPPQKTDFSQLIQNLEEKVPVLSKSEFYKKGADIMRQYFDENIENWLSLKNYQELVIRSASHTKLSDFLPLYRELYFPEYSDGEDSQEQRIALLEKLKKAIII